jgi:NitT/TauT family transport system substrate-binding protein
MTPQDLVGKRIAVDPGGETAVLFPAYLTQNGLETSDVEMVNLTADAQPAAFTNGQIDGFIGFYADLATYEETGLNLATQKFSDFGLQYSPGETLVASQEMMDSNPDLVRRFVKCMTEAVAYAVDHPEEAAQAAHALQPDSIDEEAAQAGVELLVPILKPRLEDGTLFKMTDEQWKDTIDLLVQYADLEGAKAPSDYYTNEFLP